MPSYQIILTSNEILPDDEFRARVRQSIEPAFTIVEARNLEGIKEAVWKKPVVSRQDDYSDLL